MTHKIIHTGNYLLIFDTSKTDHLDSSKIGDPIAHLPLNGSHIIEGVDLLPPYEYGVDEFELFLDKEVELNLSAKKNIERIKWYYQTYFKERYKYTEEDMSKAINIAHNYEGAFLSINDVIQSLHQYPTEFECDMGQIIGCQDPMCCLRGCHVQDGTCIAPRIDKRKRKTITTAQGVQWVGKYK